MRFISFTQRVAVLAAAVGMLIPSVVLSADELPEPAATNATQVVDVELGPNNVLRGNLVDAAGTPTPAVNVFLIQKGSILASGLSNDRGAFAIANVRGGTYEISAGERTVEVRCWKPGTAPPKTVEAALIQVNDVQRGQVHPGTCLIANPWIIAGVAAAAIVIPIGIKNIRDNRDDEPDGSPGGQIAGANSAS